ncbi:hypothetical protein [Romboutsia sp. 1001713B170131_170501_G6]|uniref:hypothetical protein n=1 Tax=Romboutsia sp. 1001713B170131_170501_G6 TaxID=2787108 RepID=UPI0018A883A5|nr:hypothetical protein [Romboutsia sp. 1001713B170131_170501_G6]
MNEYIGIVIRNQNDKFLLCDGSFYIKTRLDSNKDVKDIIKTEIYNVLEKDIFKIRKIYEEKIIHRYEEITLYLVDVGVYTNDYDFMSIDKLVSEIINFDDKNYFNKYILKPEEYSSLISTTFTLLMLVITVNIFHLPQFIHNIYSYTLGGFSLIFIYIIFNRYLKPKLIKSLAYFKFNVKIANYITSFLLIIYCIITLF